MKRTRASWRHAHLAYRPEQDDELSNAAARCAMDCRVDDPAFVAGRFYAFGVVEGFADMWEVAPGVTVPRAGVVLWAVDEYMTICELVGEFR